MKKLNKKGVTLIELIVSFAIVSVAMIYFYQTIVDLHRMYKNSNKATDEFVNKDYALRVLDAYIEKNGVSSLDNVCENYLLSYCSTANVTKDGVFSKVELKDSTGKVLVTSYTSDVEQLTSIMDKNSIEQIEKEYIINGASFESIKFNKEGLYKLKYLVSAEDKKCMIRLDSTTSIHFNKDKIIQLDGLTISDVSREIEDKNVYITLNKIKLEQTSELNYMSFGGKCTIKLVEAYKYK